MASPSIRPHMLVADEQGNIYDHPDFLLLCRRGEEWSLPRPDELMPLPEESELFLLPGRRAVGLNPETGETEVMEDWAVAAFAAPAHTLTAHPVYMTDEGAPMLPLFAYGAVWDSPPTGVSTSAPRRWDEGPCGRIFKGISARQESTVPPERSLKISRTPGSCSTSCLDLYAALRLPGGAQT